MNLEEMLRQRAEEARLSPATLNEVRGRARRIRRRRAATAVVSTVAGVAAVAVVAAVTLPAATDRSQPLPPITHSTTVAQPSPTSAPSAETGTMIDIDPQDVDQTTSGEPLVPYWQQGTLIAPDGSPTTANDVTAFGFSSQGNGNDWIVAKQGGPTGWTITDTQFSDTPMPTTAPDIAVTGDYTAKAYLAEFTKPSSGQKQWEIHIETGGMLGGPHTWGLPGKPSEGSGVDGILVGEGVLATVDGQLRVYKADQSAPVPVPGTYVSAGVLDNGMVALETVAGSQQPQPCWTIVNADDLTDATAIQNGHRLCGPEVLSSNGTDLLALDFGTPNGGPGGLTHASIIDLSTWKTTAQFLAPANGAFSSSVGWYKDSVIVPTFAGTPDATGKTFNGQWALVWLNTDGTWKVGRSSQKTGTFDQPPYKLGQGPLPITAVVSGG